jgi:hypothetical protein
MEPAIRRQPTPEERAAIIRKHSVDRAAVPDACEEHDLHPFVFANVEAMSSRVIVAPAIIAESSRRS